MDRRLRAARRRVLTLAAAGAAAGLAGCVSRPLAPVSAVGSGSASSSGVPSAAARPARAPLRIGLALGGGAARGFAHVGVVAALERAGHRVDLIAGTSAGSLVGALHAAGLDAARLRAAALSFDESVLGDWSVGARSVLAGRALQDVVNRLVGGRPIERLALPFAAVATDLYNGRRIVFRRGDTGLAVRASSAVPGVFQPVPIDGREYVDGGLCSPVPVRTCREMGAEVVIAVDISARPQFQETASLPQLMLQTFAIMGQSIAAHELPEADVVVRPAIGDLGSAAFEARRRSIEEGERAMNAALPQLAQRLAQAR